MWAVWLHHPCCLGGSRRLRVGDKIRSGPTCGRFGYINLAILGVPKASEWATKSEVGPHVGGWATSPLLSRRSPMLESGGQNQKWAHMWAVWLHHPCCLGGPQRLRLGHKIRRGPTCGRFGYITPAVLGVPKASEWATKSEVGPHVGGLATSPLLCRGSPTLESGGQKLKWAHMWAVWLHHPCCLGGPQRLRLGHKIRRGPTCGRFGYITPAILGVPKASELATKSEVGPHVGGLATSPLLSRRSQMLESGGQNQKWANMWAVWLHHPCCLGGPQRLRVGHIIRRGPRCGRFGYITPAISEIPNA